MTSLSLSDKGVSQEIPEPYLTLLLCFLTDSSDRSLEPWDLRVYSSNAKYGSGISCETPLSDREREVIRSDYLIRQQETWMGSEAGLKLSPQKCKFAQRKCLFLGSEISSAGIHGPEDRLTAVSEYPKPKNAKALKRYLGLMNWFKKFILITQFRSARIPTLWPSILSCRRQQFKGNRLCPLSETPKTWRWRSYRQSCLFWFKITF